MAPWQGLGTLNNHLGGLLSPPGGRVFRLHCASSGPVGRILARTSLGPRRPKPPITGPGGSRTSASGLSVPVHGQHVACPQMVSVGPIWARLGPDCALRSETENWPYLGPDGLNHDSKCTFSLCQAPLVLLCLGSRSTCCACAGLHVIECARRSCPKTFAYPPPPLPRFPLLRSSSPTFLTCRLRKC